MARPGKGWLQFGGTSVRTGGSVSAPNQGTPKADAFDVVKRFLEDVHAGRRNVREVQAIKDEVRTLVSRLERVQKLFPGRPDLELSDDLKLLVRLLKPGRGLLGKAALF